MKVIVALVAVWAGLMGAIAGQEVERAAADKRLRHYEVDAAAAKEIEHDAWAKKFAAYQAERVARDGKTDREVLGNESSRVGGPVDSTSAKRVRRAAVLARPRLCGQIRPEGRAQMGQAEPVQQGRDR